jgi:iron(III) transport system ATP-binding protein
MATPPVLSVHDVHKSFGAHHVLHGVQLDVHPGDIVAVLGPSGCGKTTLLRLIAGFDQLDSGTITIDGRVVASNDKGSKVSLPPERRRVGVVPQEGALFPHLDVAGNVGFGLPRGAQSAERVAEVLALVGLDGRQHQRPHELSGGQQQRVALARALAPNPSLVLLDEPFSSLDAAMRNQVRDEVFDVLRAAGATAILVTHDQQEALSVADHVAVLMGGRVAQFGEPAQLYAAPTTLQVATFVGEAVVLAGTAAGRQATCALGTLTTRETDPIDGAVQVVVRPEQVAIAATDGPRSAPPDAVSGMVVSRSYFGHDGLVRVAVGDVVVACRTAAGELPPRGTEVHVWVTSPVMAFRAAG